MQNRSKGSCDPLLEFCPPPIYLGNVEARNFRFSTEMDGWTAVSNREKCKIIPKGVMWGSRGVIKLTLRPNLWCTFDGRLLRCHSGRLEPECGTLRKWCVDCSLHEAGGRLPASLQCFSVTLRLSDSHRRGCQLKFITVTVTITEALVLRPY